MIEQLLFWCLSWWMMTITLFAHPWRRIYLLDAGGVLIALTTRPGCAEDHSPLVTTLTPPDEVLTAQQRKLLLIRSLAFSPDGKKLAAGADAGDWGGVLVWDTEMLDNVAAVARDGGHVCSLAFSHDGKTLASASNEATILLLNATTGELDRLLDGAEARVLCVAFSPVADLLASGCSMPSRLHENGGDSRIRLWNSRTGQSLKTIIVDELAIGAVAFAPDGKSLASAGWGGVKIWDVATGALKTTLEGREGVRSLAFSPEGTLLVSGAYGRLVKVWDVATGRAVRRLWWWNSRSPKTVAFSPRGNVVAMGDGDRIVLFDVDTGRRTGLVMWHPRAVSAIAFSPDGATLASASQDCVRLWRVQANPTDEGAEAE